VASRKIDALRVVIVSYPTSIVLSALAAPLFGGHPDRADLVWAAVSGVAAGLAIWWFYLALANGPMAVVSPSTAVLVAGIVT
jgi:uncharacterized membrane protein